MTISSSKEDSAGQRWWEFYGIRYGMGTVIGAITLYLLFKSNDLLSPLLFLPKDNHFEGFNLILLAVYGLAYCYISSGPILVLHAGRFILNSSYNPLPSRIRVPLLFGLPAVIAIITYLFSRNGGDAKMLCSVSAFIIAFISILQTMLVAICLIKHDKMYAFYTNLSNKRANAKGDIVNSYKHLREHGNSFFIVLLEMALGCVLVTASKYNFIWQVPIYTPNISFYLLILLLWIFPATLVWLIATFFERDFMS